MNIKDREKERKEWAVEEGKRAIKIRKNFCLFWKKKNIRRFEFKFKSG